MATNEQGVVIEFPQCNIISVNESKKDDSVLYLECSDKYIGSFSCKLVGGWDFASVNRLVGLPWRITAQVTFSMYGMNTNMTWHNMSIDQFDYASAIKALNGGGGSAKADK